MFSLDLIVKSVFSKFSFRKLSNELTNLSLIFKVSAKEKGVETSIIVKIINVFIRNNIVLKLTLFTK